MTNLYLVKNFKIYTTKIISLVLFVVLMFALTGCGSITEAEVTPTRKYHTTSIVLTTDEAVYDKATDKVISPKALEGKAVTDITPAYKVGVNYFASEPDIIYCADDVTTCTHGYTFLGTTSKIDSATTATINGKTYGVVTSGDALDWKEFNAVAGDPIHDWITISGENHWVFNRAKYPTTANRPSVNGTLVNGIKVSTVSPAEFNLLRVMNISAPFDLNVMIGDDDNLYLFTKSGSENDFTFHLLFVKGNKYIQVDNVQYYQEGYYPNPAPGKITPGNRCWNVDPEFPTGFDKTIIANPNVDIYMVVTVYGNDSVAKSKKNVIRIK